MAEKQIAKKKVSKRVAKKAEKPVERKLKEVPAEEWLDRLYGITRKLVGEGADADFHDMNTYGYKAIKKALKKK